jgi:hypothetical protein
MQWITLAGTALGAFIALLATTLNERWKWQRVRCEIALVSGQTALDHAETTFPLLRDIRDVLGAAGATKDSPNYVTLRAAYGLALREL